MHNVTLLSHLPLFFVLLLVSCSPDYLREEELAEYVLDADNGLTRSVDYNGYQAKVTYRPSDLLIVQETGGVVDIKKQELDRLRKKYSDHYYFILSLSKNNREALYSSGHYGQFSNLMQTLSFRMRNYVKMTTSEKDTIEVADYIYSRTFGMSRGSNLMFVFSKEEINEDEWLQFNLKEFGLGLGNQNFRFSLEDLKEVPKIKFKISN